MVALLLYLEAFEIDPNLRWLSSLCNCFGVEACGSVLELLVECVKQMTG